MDQKKDRPAAPDRRETDKKTPSPEDRHEKRPEGPYKDVSDEGRQGDVK